MSEFSNEFDWNHARAFLATAQTGSLSRAAKALKRSQPTLSRQIAALEERLGVLLFDRVGQRLVLTPAGSKLVSIAEEMNLAARRFDIGAQSASQSTSGHVSVTMSDNFAASFMPFVLKRAAKLAPNITIDVHADNHVEDISRREADIALRHVEPQQGELIAKRLGDVRAYLYGARAYLDHVGRPKTLNELAALELVGFGEVREVIAQSRAYGLKALPESVHYAANSGIVAWEMARAGLGLIYMAEPIARRAPEMEAVLPDESAIQFPVWLVTHKELRTNPRIRIIFDLMAECFSDLSMLSAQNE